MGKAIIAGSLPESRQIAVSIHSFDDEGNAILEISPVIADFDYLLFPDQKRMAFVTYLQSRLTLQDVCIVSD